jgi:hypothetical protein
MASESKLARRLADLAGGPRKVALDVSAIPLGTLISARERAGQPSSPDCSARESSPHRLDGISLTAGRYTSMTSSPGLVRHRARRVTGLACSSCEYMFNTATVEPQRQRHGDCSSALTLSANGQTILVVVRRFRRYERHEYSSASTSTRRRRLPRARPAQQAGTAVAARAVRCSTTRRGRSSGGGQRPDLAFRPGSLIVALLVGSWGQKI